MNVFKISLLALICLIPFFSSCSVENSQDKPIIDYPTYGYVTSWNETKRKMGEEDWETISNGNKLSFFSDIADSVKLRNGAYRYDASNLKINVDTSGYFLQKDSLLYLATGQNRSDTTIVKYKIYNDSLLIITNITENPNVKVKYRKIK